MEMVNGYVFLDLTKTNVYAKALKVLGTDKPVVIKDGSGSPYFVDSLTLDGTNVVITKGGKTITIANDNTITNVGLIANPTLENIVDLNGNNRFIEGVIPTETITGLTFTYNKWSLSGTHLMFVLAGDVDAGANIPASFYTENIELPQWVKDKIAVLYSNIVLRDSLAVFDDNGNSLLSAAVRLVKASDNITMYASAVNNTSTEIGHFRIQFDLLIDQE